MHNHKLYHFKGSVFSVGFAYVVNESGSQLVLQQGFASCVVGISLVISRADDLLQQDLDSDVQQLAQEWATDLAPLASSPELE